MCGRVHWYTCIDDAKDRAAFVFRVRQYTSTLLGLFDWKMKATHLFETS
jgi:hypothetical protein